MQINVLAFGQIAEAMNGESFTFSNINTTNDLIDYLMQQYASLKTFDFKIAVNKQIIHSNMPLKNHDTVALLPPFSGG